MSWELIALGCIMVILVLLVLLFLFRKKLFKKLRRKQELFVKEVVTFQKAQTSSSKDNYTEKSARKDISLGGVERNHSFLTINKDLSEQERSGMMSFQLNSNLQLDTIQQTEENDAAKVDFDLEKELRGAYIDTTSAKNSTKNSTKKEFFVNFKKNDTSRVEEEVSYELEHGEGCSQDEEVGPGQCSDPEEEQTPAPRSTISSKVHQATQ